MRPNRLTVLALALAAGTALGLAAPATGQTAVTSAASTAGCRIQGGLPWCRVIVYKGAGGGGQGLAALPSVAASPEHYTLPKVLTVNVKGGTEKLTMAVASLEPAFGTCTNHCSDWWTYYNGNIEVLRFDFGHGVVGYDLSVPIGNTNWFEPDPATGTWSPVYLQWYANTTPASTWYCIHLKTTAGTGSYQWTLVSTGTLNGGVYSCP